MNTPPSFYPAIAARLTAMIRKGFTADSELIHFLDSTFACPGTAEIETLLAETADDDAEGLYALIMTPSHERRLEMEAFLEKVAPPEMEPEQVRPLLSSSLQSALFFSDRRPPANFFATTTAMMDFLARFHLTRRFDIDIITALAHSLPEENRRLEARVLLRTSRILLTDCRRQTLIRYFDTSGHLPEKIFFPCLQELLMLFRRPPGREEGLAELTTERQNCLRQMEQSDHLERELRRNNLETLILQGRRGFLSVDRKALEKKIHTLETLGRLLFGQALPSEPEPPCSFSFEKPPPQ